MTSRLSDGFHLRGQPLFYDKQFASNPLTCYGRRLPDMSMTFKLVDYVTIPFISNKGDLTFNLVSGCTTDPKMEKMADEENKKFVF